MSWDHRLALDRRRGRCTASSPLPSPSLSAPVHPAVNRGQGSPCAALWHGHAAQLEPLQPKRFTKRRTPNEGVLTSSKLRLARRTCCAVSNPTPPSYAVPVLEGCSSRVEENPNAAGALSVYVAGPSSSKHIATHRYCLLLLEVFKDF